MNQETILRARIKVLTWVFILGLIFSGATAIPLEPELNLLAKFFGVADKSSIEVASGMAHWILRSRSPARHQCEISVSGVWNRLAGVRTFCNRSGVHRGIARPGSQRVAFYLCMIACVMIVPYAFIFGGVRGIPVYWRLIDCSFGVFGILPIWYLPPMRQEIEMLRPMSKI